MFKFKLKDVDLKDNTGILAYQLEDGTKDEVTVSLSGLLAYRIANFHNERRLKRGTHYVRTIFESDNKCESYGANPFRLVKFIPEGNSDIKVNFRLEAVDEACNYLRDAITRKIQGYENYILTPMEYHRYEVRQVTACICDMPNYHYTDPYAHKLESIFFPNA